LDARDREKENASAGRGYIHMVVAASDVDAGTCPPQARCALKGRGRERARFGSEGNSRETERERERREKGRRREREREREGVVGSESCDCFGFDLGSIYRVYARMCLNPPTRRSVSNATNPMNVHTEATSESAYYLQFTFAYIHRARTHIHRPIDVAMNLRENLTLLRDPSHPEGVSRTDRPTD